MFHVKLKIRCQNTKTEKALDLKSDSDRLLTSECPESVDVRCSSTSQVIPELFGASLRKCVLDFK